MLIVTKQNLLNRLQNYPHGNYITVLSAMKGVALANAAVVTKGILADPNPTSVLFWVSSLGALILTHQAAMFGIIFTAWYRFGFTETFLSFFLGILEFGLFGLANSSEIGPWLLCFAGFSAIGGLLAYNAFSVALPERYEKDLKVAIREYRRSQRTVTVIAWVSAAFWTIVSIIAWNKPPGSITGYGLGALAVINIGGALYNQSRYTDKLSAFLFNKSEAKAM
jgi:hypothetical protein